MPAERGVGDASLKDEPAHEPYRRAQPVSGRLHRQQPVHHSGPAPALQRSWSWSWSVAPPWPPVALPAPEPLPRQPATPPRSSDTRSPDSARRRPRSPPGRPPDTPRHPAATCRHGGGIRRRRPRPAARRRGWWSSGGSWSSGRPRPGQAARTPRSQNCRERSGPQITGAASLCDNCAGEVSFPSDHWVFSGPEREPV
jgi:hypothetical protein